MKRGQETEEFYLSRRQALFITAKSGTETATEITVEVVRRFDEYERGGGAAAPAINVRDPEQLNIIAAQLLEVRQELQQRAERAEQQVALLEPKAAGLDRLSARTGSENISDTAKALGVRPMRLFAWLEAHRWIFRRRDGGPWRGYQDKLDARYLEHVETQDRLRPDRTFTMCLVTAKGRARLAELLAGEAAP